MEYKPTIGLEIHAELKTNTKMFCSCKNDPDEKTPNVNICPVCLGHPGTLPVINKKAVEHVLKVGLSLEGKMAEDSEFDRKNYFYPDIPKGYQISQYKYPLISGGNLMGVKITRVHLEEDTARSSHEKGEYSLLDFNRAGVPLMELVTEPSMHSASEVVEFAGELQKLLQYLEVSDANMEKGEMRLEANISVSNSDKLGTKVEVKNLNSFRSAGRAVEFEIDRQSTLLMSGEKVLQETRGWDESKQETFAQRSKEHSHDYRYFPDPDLPKLKISEIKGFDRGSLMSAMNETPDAKRERFKSEYNIKDSDIDFYISNKSLSDFFEKSAGFCKNKEEIQPLSNYITSDLAGLGTESVSAIIPEHMAELAGMFIRGEVSSRAAKDMLLIMTKSPESPMKIAEKEGLFQKNNEEELVKIAKEIIDQNKSVAQDYKNGKASALQFLIGQAMKKTKGSANPQTLKSIFETLT